jgi:hypothetical protein
LPEESAVKPAGRYVNFGWTTVYALEIASKVIKILYCHGYPAGASAVTGGAEITLDEAATESASGFFQDGK